VKSEMIDEVQPEHDLVSKVRSDNVTSGYKIV
jgi:hypothetical protein